MGNTITKGNSFGEVVEALKLKGVKAYRKCWLDDGEEFSEEENDYYIYYDEEKNKIKDCDLPYDFEFETEDYFAEDWVIVYPN